MKKIILVLACLFVPFLASASIDANLYYGLRNNAEVTELQEFLIDKGFLDHEPTGSFLSLTLKAVKQYQASVEVNSTGYVGILTRKAINDDIRADLEGSNHETTTETGSTLPMPEPQKITNDIVSGILAQIALLQQQLNVMNAQNQAVQQSNQQLQQSVQQIQQNTQQIVQNTQPAQPEPNIIPPPTPNLEPLVFTETPKLVWRTIGYEYNDPNRPINRLSYTTWKTNRSTKLILAPVIPLYDSKNEIHDWTTRFTEKTQESCPSGVSMEEDDICTLKC